MDFTPNPHRRYHRGRRGAGSSRQPVNESQKEDTHLHRVDGRTKKAGKAEKLAAGVRTRKHLSEGRLKRLAGELKSRKVHLRIGRVNVENPRHSDKKAAEPKPARLGKTNVNQIVSRYKRAGDSAIKTVSREEFQALPTDDLRPDLKSIYKKLLSFSKTDGWPGNGDDYEKEDTHKARLVKHDADARRNLANRRHGRAASRGKPAGGGQKPSRTFSKSEGWKGNTETCARRWEGFVYKVCPSCNEEVRIPHDFNGCKIVPYDRKSAVYRYTAPDGKLKIFHGLLIEFKAIADKWEAEASATPSKGANPPTAAESASCISTPGAGTSASEGPAAPSSSPNIGQPLHPEPSAPPLSLHDLYKETGAVDVKSPMFRVVRERIRQLRKFPIADTPPFASEEARTTPLPATVVGPDIPFVNAPQGGAARQRLFMTRGGDVVPEEPHLPGVPGGPPAPPAVRRIQRFRNWTKRGGVWVGVLPDPEEEASARGYIPRPPLMRGLPHPLAGFDFGNAPADKPQPKTPPPLGTLWAYNGEKWEARLHPLADPVEYEDGLRVKSGFDISFARMRFLHVREKTYVRCTGYDMRPLNLRAMKQSLRYVVMQNVEEMGLRVRWPSVPLLVMLNVALAVSFGLNGMNYLQSWWLPLSALTQVVLFALWGVEKVFVRWNHCPALASAILSETWGSSFEAAKLNAPKIANRAQMLQITAADHVSIIAGLDCCLQYFDRLPFSRFHGLQTILGLRFEDFPSRVVQGTHGIMKGAAPGAVSLWA